MENVEQTAEQSLPTGYSEKDIQVLAKAQAEEIIQAGYQEVVGEVDRLAQVGMDKLSARDKAVFMTLAQYRQGAERAMELSKIGVPEEEYNSREFTEFASQFASFTPYGKIYELYQKTKPKKEFMTMGSMKSTDSKNDGVKDYYAFEEAKRFTKRDFDKNPKLFAAVQRSMTKW